MKTFNALTLSLLAAISVFGAQHYLAPAQLHAAPFVVPAAADWRQQMIATDPGGAIIDHRLAELTDRLDLTTDQVGKLKPLLTAEHSRILALLVAGPAKLTREQFIADRRVISDQTHEKVLAVLTPDQRQLDQYFRLRRG